MLELQNLSKSYRGIPAISNVNFRVNAGEVVGYLGANGSGKSTTVKIITGLLQPSEGRVLFEGRNIRDDLASFRAALGYVPEEAHLYTYLSGFEYLQLVGRLRGTGGTADSNQGHQVTAAAWPGVLAVFANLHVFQGDEAARADRCGAHA